MASSLDINALRSAVRGGRIEWQRHALERMVERNVTRAQVKAALLGGERIAEYPDAYPLPAALFMAWRARRPLHVVAALDATTATAYVITAHEPDLEHFEPDFRTRRKG